jgi:hypothetical protein
MNQSTGRFIVGLAASLLVATAAYAQAPAAVTRQVTGEVLKVDGLTLTVKMSPTNEVRTFTASRGRTATVDGQVIPIERVLPGTVLTATVTWVPAPGTMTTVSGQVVFVALPAVTVRLSDGTIKQYTPPPNFEFTLEGKKATAQDLRPGQNLTAVRLTEDPATKITPESPITVKGPKK